MSPLQRYIATLIVGLAAMLSLAQTATEVDVSDTLELVMQVITSVHAEG